MIRPLHFIIAFAFLMLLSMDASAQRVNSPPVSDTASYPYWIQMMQDPDASFHATQSAFEKYWANRPEHKGNGWKVSKTLGIYQRIQGSA